MQVYHSLAPLTGFPPPLALAIGFFDGLHRGHQAVLDTAREAVGPAGQVCVLTFEPHPLKVIRPGGAPPMLTAAEHKLRLLEAAGLDGVVLLRFDNAFRSQAPEDFWNGLCAAAPGLRAIAVGADWQFGHDQHGNAHLLADWGAARGIQVSAVPPVCWDGAPVSSTRIRQALATGQLEAAAAMLGRPFSIRGLVRAGRAVGRTLGFPTANLRPDNEVLPPTGVYAAEVQFGDARQPAAAYVGTRPTYGLREPVVEVHLLDREIDLYHQEIELYFHRRIRGELAFPDPAALRAQIAADVTAIRAALPSAAPVRPCN